MRVSTGNRLAWPYLAGLFLLVAVPTVMAMGIALTEFSGIRSPRFIGLDNFTRMWGDDLFWKALGNSVVYVLIAVPLRLLAAVGFALLLNRRTRGVGLARPIAYLPSVIPDAAYALLWLWILNPLYGPFAAFTRSIGLGDPGTLTDPWATRIAIAVMAAFQIGEAFVVALAARRSISPSLYEASVVDGATPFFALRRITLPSMAPILGLLVLRDVVLALQTNFVPALLITEGGPRYATTYLSYFVYRNAFGHFRLGYASAVSMTMFVLTAVAIYGQYRLVRRWRD